MGTQRHCKEYLSAERKWRLDAVGFIWDWRDYRWEVGFAALLKFLPFRKWDVSGADYACRASCQPLARS